MLRNYANLNESGLPPIASPPPVAIAARSRKKRRTHPGTAPEAVGGMGAKRAPLVVEAEDSSESDDVDYAARGC